MRHEVALIPPQYVKPYGDRGKNDAADAAAICEAMSRPKLAKRLVPIKTIEHHDEGHSSPDAHSVAPCSTPSGTPAAPLRGRLAALRAP